MSGRHMSVARCNWLVTVEHFSPRVTAAPGRDVRAGQKSLRFPGVPAPMAVAAPEPVTRAVHRRARQQQKQSRTVLDRAMRYLPRGNLLDDSAWQRRHRILRVLLALHVPALAVFGLAMGRP